jgi:tetratricopeptide (TPR) repeat protein
MIAYVNYWLTVEVPEKKRLIDECWRLVKECLKASVEAGKTVEYGKAYNQLSQSALLGFYLEWDFNARKNKIMEALKHAEQAITFLSTIGDPHELARAYVRAAAYLQVHRYYFLELDEQKRHFQKAAGYWLKANEASEEAAMIELLSTLGEPSLDWGDGTDETLMNFKKALEYGKKTRDQFIVGCALDWLAYHTSWKAFATDDYDRRVELFKRALQYAEDAKHYYSTISFISPRGDTYWTQAPHAEHYFDLARFETNLSKRRELLEKAVEAAPELLKLAENSGYPEAIINANHVSSLILWFLAKTEMNSEEKKELLEKALRHRNESIRLTEQLQPFAYWNRGINQGVIARIKSELAGLTRDSETKKTMLQEAILDYETAVKLCNKGLEFYEKEDSISLSAVLGLGQYECGGLLSRLTDDRKQLRNAIKIVEEAAESFQKPNMTSRVAECYWKIAQIYEKLGEHSKAAENFKLASNNYKDAAEKIPQLRDFYMDHALYMQAWSEIELAKHHHEGKRYDKAKLHYEKSASLHESTEHWNYLSSNYYAWTRLEEAEDLSRKERAEKAKDFFQQAANLFMEAKKSVGARLEKIENEDEIGLAVNLAEASDIRWKYCLGRIALEEARILDRQGNHAASSMKYGVAADKFQEVTEALEDESDRQELTPIIELSKAWQMMTKAEAEASPAVYVEASQLFEQAKDHSIDEKAKVLALGHSVFCKALEAGTRFEKTRDMETYSKAKQHLVAAENYYVKAGFKEASEYAEATHRLLDAYMCVYKAETEIEPGKKLQYYQMSEKLLQMSAASYTKSKHLEKTKQVKRLLEKVREEQKLATSLSEMLHAPFNVSSTESFVTPSQTREKAVGLERFEDADIQARIAVPDEIKVNEDFDFRIDLVNAGRNTGLLVRIDNLIPNGFKINALPPKYSIENGSIDMKGRSLAPLNVESIKFIVQAVEAGLAKLSPQVVYVDENGKFRTCKPEPITVTIQPKLAFEFKTEATKVVFDFLIGAFVEDYMKRRISLEKSGWRTLMDVVKEGKVSKSCVYGAGGCRGRGISELEGRGLVEIRVYPGERGRGGKVLKIRIACEKETIKRYIDEHVMKIKEK